MPDFVPFRALRYGADAATAAATGPEHAVRDLTRVCAPPYDVIEPEDRAALLGVDPHNMVRLILPDAYDEAAATLARWRDDAVLALDDRPSFSVYRMTFTGDDGTRTTTTGVIGALALDPGAVLPHERTLPKAKSDRLELLRATRANLEPVWGISLAAGLSTLLTPAGAPLARADDRDGGVHELWRVDDPATVAAIRAAVSGDGVVLADGHHRYETSCTYRDERVADGIDDAGAGFIMILVVELADDELCVRAIHRLLHGVEGVDLRERLGPWFTVRGAGPNTPDGVTSLEAAMRADGGLGLVDHDGLALLLPRPELDAAMAELPAPLRDVDSARFDAGVLPAVAGATLAYRNDARTVAAQVAKGAADAAVLLRPVSVATIRAAAAAGVRMPEKTTFFAPKPRTGMVLRAFDDQTDESDG
ncbi:MAG TPA: DUF1015 domain-containing protein [Acidimicrobiia bacterium]|nr:DUF1015 domain-containing protein [Acidimicrobiia bacterium]